MECKLKIGIFIAFFFVLVGRAQRSPESQRTAQSNVVSRYIQAAQHRDYKTLIDLTYVYQADVAGIKAQNPQVLWSKLIGEYYEGKIKNLSQDPGYWGNFLQGALAGLGDPTQSIRILPELVPLSCNWSVSESRQQRGVPSGYLREFNITTVYVTVTYSGWRDAPVLDNKILKQTILEFAIDSDSQTVLRVNRMPAADVFSEDSLRILNVTYGVFEPQLGVQAAGGAPPLKCSVGIGSGQQTQSDCSRPNSSVLWINLPSSVTRNPTRLSVQVIDAKGRKDEVYVSLPSFPGGMAPPLWRYCWIRDPWFDRGTARPPDAQTTCKQPIFRLGEGNAAAAMTPEAAPATTQPTSQVGSGVAVQGGGDNTVPGHYLNDQNATEYLDLGPHDKFFWKVGGRDFAGSYDVTGDILTLRFPPVGATARGKLDGGRFNCCLSNGLGPGESALIDDESKNWVRQGEPQPAPGTIEALSSTIGRTTPLPEAKQDARSTASDAGYKLRLNNAIYIVRKLNLPGQIATPIFFDAALHPVSDSVLLRRLALSSWTVDNVIRDPSYRLRNRSNEVASLLETTAALKRYEVVQDELVRVSVEIFAATVSDGRTLGGFLGRAVKQGVTGQLEDPQKYLLAVTAISLVRSMQDFQQMESVMARLTPNIYDVDQLERAQSLYREASGLLQTFRPVAVALMPEHWTDLVNQALSSTGSQLLSVLQSLPEAAVPAQFVDALWSKIGQIETAGNLQLLAQNAKLARDYSAGIDRLVDRWTSQSTETCRATSVPAMREVLLGAFEYDGSHYLLVPFLLYDGQRYISLNDGVGPSGIGLARTDYLSSNTGQVNPNSPGAVTALKQSVLNRVKEFEVYRHGRKIGHFSVNQISAVTFDLFTKVAGGGVATGFEPGGQDIAVAGPAGHTYFWPTGNLTAAQKNELRTTAMNMIPKMMPPPPTWMVTAGQTQVVQKFSGKQLVFGQPSDSSILVSLTKQGPSLVSMELTAPIHSPGDYPGQFSVYVYLLGSVPNGKPITTPVFSSVYITGETALDVYGEGSFQLLDVLDIDGDNAAEVILMRGYDESGEINVFSYRGGRLQKLLTIGWAGS